MSELTKTRFVLSLILLGIAGMLVSGYLIFQHYDTSGESFCDVNDYINCDIVNKSMYAEVAGVPVAILGLVAYFVIFLTAVGLRQNWFLRARPVIAALGIFTGLSFLFSLYLTYVEFFVLRAVCIFCLTSQAIILAIFLISLSLWLKLRKLPA